MSKQILSNLWQVGGDGLTHPADAAAYLVRFQHSAALVDAGTANAHSRLKKNIAACLRSEDRLEYVLLTHCHFDHTGGAAAVREDFGCSIVAHMLDAAYLEAGDNEVTAASWYGANLDALPIDIKLQGEESEITVGNGSIKAIHWPGHSPGSVVYVTEIDGLRVLFGQDVHGPIHPALLSDEARYQESLKKLVELDADILLEGHYGIIRSQDEIRAFIRSFMR